MNAGLVIVSVTLLLVAAVSRPLSSTPITPAMVVVAVGVLVGPLVLNDLTVPPTSSTVRTLAKATLAVVLFSDSSRVNLRALQREASMPVRLLSFGLPLTIVLGGLLAVALFGSFSFSEVLILGVILAPTDAGLGSAVVTDPRLPQVVRQSLNVESGLNDGICVPLLIVLATVSGAGGESHPLQVLAEEIGYGLLGGLAAGALDYGGGDHRRRTTPDRRCVAADQSPGRGGARVRDRERPGRFGVHRRIRRQARCLACSLATNLRE